MTDITPPPELTAIWVAEIYGNGDPAIPLHPITLRLVERAAQWGADQELEACCEWFTSKFGAEVKADIADLRAARRPPTTLKQQALRAAHIEVDPQGKNGSLIIRALEALPDD